MKFCFVSPGYGSMKTIAGHISELGGAEAQIALLATSFAKIGHRVVLLYGNGSDQVSSKTVAGVECIEAFPCWKNPKTIFRYWHILSVVAADVVYARLPNDFLGLLRVFTWLQQHTTFVYAIANDAHCNPWHVYDYHRWFHNSAYALGLRSADVVALQHEGQRALVTPFTRARLVLIPNLLPTLQSEARKLTETQIDAIWVAQIRPAKQLDLFLEVAENLPELSFAVVGGFNFNLSGQEQQALRMRMQALPNLTYFGLQHRTQAQQLIRQSKLLVNTSLSEGFPNTMLEAWGAGVPVVSLTVDPGNVIQARRLGKVSHHLAQMIEDITLLVRDASLNQELGIRGLEYVKARHSFRAVCSAFEEIIAGVVPADATFAAGE